MGFLTAGNTLIWEEASEKPIDFVRNHGITQFLNIYNKVKDRKRDTLKWGDEVEYIVLSVDKQSKTVQLSLRGHEILEQCEEIEKEQEEKGEEPTSLWRPEYAKYMIEGTPGTPFGANGMLDLLKIEPSMKLRRKEVEKFLAADEFVVSVASYPMLGAIEHGPYTKPHYEPGGPVAMSVFTPDEIIHPHHRFSTLTANIRKRRGAKVEINVPIYRDKNTPEILEIPPSPLNPPQIPHNIYMDSMAFGMGCCCLQSTFQCCHINEARTFYDQLAVLSPIMLAITVACPIFRGHLAEVDSRWNIIAAAVDDRTEEERGLKPLKKNKFVINKSRYDSIDNYISLDAKFRPEYNDIPLVFDKEIKQKLQEGGIDESLANHVSHLFIRDPLVIYRDRLMIDDEKFSDHFENIQSTNWRTVRFKVPPPQSTIGWRVEFRSMEVQLSDFENAAFVVFIVMITRILSAFDLNFYIPISQVDKNMDAAQKRDAALNQKFYFRKNVYTKTSDKKEAHDDKADVDLMTINEIFNGKDYENSERFPGLIELIHIYLDTINLKGEARDQVSKYLDFIKKKASGELMTTAAWMRDFVVKHPEYKQDSKVTPKINYDLMTACVKIGRGEFHPPELLGKFTQ